MLGYAGRPKQRLFFDTNICTDIAYQDIETEALVVRKHIRATYEYVISPLTFLELLIKIGRGGDAYFEENRKALQALVADQQEMVFLSFPGSHVLVHVLNRAPIAKFGPSDFQCWLKVVLKAPNLAALRNGLVDIGDQERLFGFDFSIVNTQQQDGKDYHRRTLEGMRNGSNTPIGLINWSEGMLTRLGQEPKPEDCQRVSAALEAAYCFDQYLWEQAKNHSYDFAKHDTDWIDLQQLFYMSDPETLFVTKDKNILKAAEKSSQGTRVLTFEKLLLEARSRRVAI